MGYKVLVDEVTVHQTVAKLPQPDGSTIYQNGLGQTYYRDEVIPDDKVAEDWREALESGEGALNDSLSKVLEQSSDERGSSAARLGVPFAGYDDMEEDDVLDAMKMLPSAAIQRIKEYEASRDEPRERITGYSVGFGESAIDRQEGRVSSDPQDTDENKASARISTREVPEDGPVVPGEGITGTGDPQVSYGSREAKEEGEPAGDIKGTGSPRSAVADVTASRSPLRARRRRRWTRRTSSTDDNSRAKSWRLLTHRSRSRRGMNFRRRGMRCWRLRRSVRRLSNVV